MMIFHEKIVKKSVKKSKTLRARFRASHFALECISTIDVEKNRSRSASGRSFSYFLHVEGPRSVFFLIIGLDRFKSFFFAFFHAFLS